MSAQEQPVMSDCFAARQIGYNDAHGNLRC